MPRAAQQAPACGGKGEPGGSASVNKTLRQQKPARVEGVGVGEKRLQACAEALLFCSAPRVFRAQLVRMLPCWRTRPLALHEAPQWTLEVGSCGMARNFSLHTSQFFLDKTLLRSLKTVHHLVCREMQQETKQVSPVWIGMAPEVK